MYTKKIKIDYFILLHIPSKHKSGMSGVFHQFSKQIAMI